jgi:signal transduction histidine kinase
MLRDEAGAPLCILEINREITGRKLSEEALRRSQSRFRSLSQANTVGVACGESAGSVVEANDAFLQMTGYSRDDLKAGRIAWADLAGVSRTPFEKEFVRKDGSRLPVLLFAGTPESPGDECVTIVLDLSERKMLENKLRQKQKLETIGLLAAGVAHDFNNLLTGILMNTQLSLDNLSAGDPGRGMLEEVIRESERAARLTSQLVAYTGKGRVSARWIDVTAVVQITVAQMRSSIPRQIRVRCEFDPHLSAIEADKDQIQQLMSYLVVNAVEAIGEKPGGEIAVSATRSNMGEVDEAWVSGFPEIRSGEYVLIRVQDNGCGMDEATLARAFDPFFSTKFLGRGLGLAAAQGIARAHHGAIRIVSAPGQGATVEVLFPTSAAASQSA